MADNATTLVTPHQIKKYGWKPSLPDARDHVFLPQAAPEVLPAKWDLRPDQPPIWDQSTLGACTGHGIAAAVAAATVRAHMSKPLVSPSRLFIYYNERVIEGTIKEDAGAMIRDGIKSVAKDGVCDEKYWKYDITKFTKKPTVTAYKMAKKYVVGEYMSVAQDTNTIKTALYQGMPVVIGFSVYSGFESEDVAKSGIMNLPLRGEKLLGGHCVLVVGYDDSLYGGRGGWIVRNSWGTGWGQEGYFFMPYNYLTNPRLSSDFWAIKGMA